VFQPDLSGSKIDDDEAIDGWEIRNFKVSVKENEYATGFGDPRPGRDKQAFSQFVIEMDIERDAWGLFMKIFLGMYIAFLIAVISFTPHPSEMEPRFGLPVGGLFAAVGNKYIIDSLLPESSSFTLVDTLHALTFVGIFATLLVSAIALKQYDNGMKERSEQTNRLGAKLVVSTYAFLNLVFVVLAII
jgi:hypothetical protein